MALVTGASSGIGEGVALALAREGVTLAVAARRRDRLEAVAARARELGATDARAFRIDFTEPASIEAALRDVRGAFGDPAILVLNGGGPKPGTLGETSLDDWDAAYQKLLRGAIELVRGVVPAMQRHRWGRIVALTSSSIKQPIHNIALSNVFRIGLVSALKSLSNEVARDGVTVNSIATGRVRTERLRELYADERHMDAAATTEVPIGRVATVDEFAPMVAFLCSDPAGYVTGQTIAIDGGLIRGTFG